MSYKTQIAGKKNPAAPRCAGFPFMFGGKPGIRTLGTLLTFAGFQDCRLIYEKQQLSLKSFPQLSSRSIAESQAAQGVHTELRK